MAGPADGREPWDSTVWFGLAVVGAFVFVVGIWIPAFAFIAAGPRLYAQMGLAALGGALFIVGLSYGFDARARESTGTQRHRLSGTPKASVRGAPSFEVYDPRVLPPPRAEGPEDPKGPTRPPP
ncbi:MAG: hypothetical protein ACREDK_06820 [Thermoplasmata archaeon]